MTLAVADAGGLTSSTERVISVAGDAWDPDAAVSEAEASRFLSQAGFGWDADAVAMMTAEGFEAWIDDQVTRAPNYLLDIGRGAAEPQSDNASHAFVNAALFGEDQLRQRLAWSLFQIIVINDSVVYSFGKHWYYDLFVGHALGDDAAGYGGTYRDLLADVTYTGAMGEFLTYKGNRKANDDGTSAPDENYAREVMQLFSVGTWELNPDGSRRRTTRGRACSCSPSGRGN